MTDQRYDLMGSGAWGGDVKKKISKKIPTRRPGMDSTTKARGGSAGANGAKKGKATKKKPGSDRSRESDQEAIQGVWRVLKITSDGRPVHTSVSHVVFEGNLNREVVANFEEYEDEGTVRTEFELRPTERPPRIIERMTWLDRNGKVTSKLTQRGVYELRKDELRIARAGEDPPEEVSDEEGDLTIYVRETDADVVAQHSKPAPKAARTTFDDDRLGRLKWDANLEWWETSYDFGEDRPAELHISGPRAAGADLFKRVGDVANRLKRALNKVKKFAADRLVDLKNDSWLGEDEARVGSKQFASRLSVQSVGVRENGRVEVYFNDGDLFWGHSIIVSLTSDLKPTSADIAG